MRVIVFLFFITLFFNCNSSNQVARENRLPNIVYIFADDLGYGDLGCFGATDIATPSIDRIAREGIKFTNLYSASSVCSPSRAGLLTGRIPQRMGINAVFFPESFTGMSPEEVTIAEMLRKENYSNGMVGKWHLGHMEKYLPLNQGFDSYFGIPYSNDMESVVYMRNNEAIEFKVDQRLTTQRYTAEAEKFIEEKKEEPFFLYLAYNMPHVPIYASDDFLGISNGGLYGDVIQEIDWSVGQVLKTLENYDLLENTLVVFSSDNGPWLVMEDHGGSAGNLREGKQYTFDGGMKVPTVAMWKGKIPAGKVYEGMCTQMDWFPTIAAITKTDLPKDRSIDGKDLSSVLFSDGKRVSDGFLFFDGAKLEGYRSGAWKIKLPYAGYPGSHWKHAVPAHDTLLFNVEKDPGERNNLFATNKSKSNQMVTEMHAAYASLDSLPPSLMVRSNADESHLEYLKSKREK